MGKLTWYKMEFDVVAQMKEICENDYAKIGKLFCAVMQTAETGEVVELKDNTLKAAYKMMCVSVQRAQTAYDKKCEKRAAAGSKGGKAKAAKQKHETAESTDDSEPAFKPPTITSFRNTAKHFCTEYEESYDDYKVDKLFNQLKADGWCYHRLKIQTADLVDAIIVAELICSRYKSIAYNFAEYCVKHNESRSFSLDAVEWVADVTDGAPPWIIDGKKCTNLQQAVEAWYTDDEDETDDPDDLPKPASPYGPF